MLYCSCQKIFYIIQTRLVQSGRCYFYKQALLYSKDISALRPTNISLSFIKDVDDGSFGFLTMEAAETFSGTCFLKKIFG